MCEVLSLRFTPSPFFFLFLLFFFLLLLFTVVIPHTLYFTEKKRCAK